MRQPGAGDGAAGVGVAGAADVGGAAAEGVGVALVDAGGTVGVVVSLAKPVSPLRDHVLTPLTVAFSIIPNCRENAGLTLKLVLQGADAESPSYSIPGLLSLLHFRPG